MSIRGHQSDPAQAAFDEVGEEAGPRRPCLAGCDPQAENFPTAISINTGGDEDERVDHPPALTDLHGQRISSNEREGTGLIKGAVTELIHVLVKLGGHA